MLMDRRTRSRSRTLRMGGPFGGYTCRMKHTVRSWPMILLMVFVVPLLGFTILLVPAMLAGSTRHRWLTVAAGVVSAVIVIGCLALMVRAFFLRVSAASGTLKIHGLFASRSIRADAVAAVTVEETWTPQGGFMRLPVVHYRDPAHGLRRLRLWASLLSRWSPRWLGSTT